jgi:hypothetical protein
MSSDLIYTSGYKLKMLNYSYKTDFNQLSIADPYANDLKRNQTLNYSVGVEYFVIDNFVVRFGHFTNRSNNEQVHWGEAALLAVYRERSLASADVNLTRNISYTLPEKRNQYINLTGYSFGIGLENARNSISLTFLIQNGKGLGTIDRNQLPTTSVYKENTVYLSGSTRY